MYKLFLTFIYLYKRRIVYFAIAAVVLCTMMVLVVSSVMGGFLDKIKMKARGLLGDVIVQNNSTRGFPLYEEFIHEARDWPEIEAITPVLFSMGILSFKGTTAVNVVQVTGVRLDEITKVNAFGDSLFYEKFYPGTTTFADQQQPLLGFDHALSPEKKGDSEIILPILPAEFRTALERSRAAGLKDTQSTPTPFNEVLKESGLAEVPGYFELNQFEEPGTDLPPPPKMDGESWPGLIIGRDLVAIREADGKYDRRVPRGAIAVLTVVPISDNGNPDTPTKQFFRYADDSRTGIFEIDSRHVYCEFELLQRLLRMDEAERSEDSEVSGRVPARCSQIQIKTRPGVDGRALCEKIEAAFGRLRMNPPAPLTGYEQRLLDGVHAMTWEESQAHFILPVEKERVLVTILFAIISLVAAVLVLCILYMIVLQKTRDIGIVKAIGGSAGGVASIFVLYGAAVGVVGTMIGATAGYLVVVNINEIQDFLISIHPSLRVWDRSVYSFDEIPNTVRTSELIGIVLIGIALSIAGSMAAAVRAGTMHPVQALRHE